VTILTWRFLGQVLLFSCLLLLFDKFEDIYCRFDLITTKYLRIFWFHNIYRPTKCTYIINTVFDASHRCSLLLHMSHVYVLDTSDWWSLQTRLDQLWARFSCGPRNHVSHGRSDPPLEWALSMGVLSTEKFLKHIGLWGLSKRASPAKWMNWSKGCLIVGLG